MITEAQIVKLLPSNKDAAEWLPYVNNYMAKYGIITKNEIAMFISQTAHESADYIHISENLNYSAQGLLRTFSRRVNSAMASILQHQPEKIANYVYANRYMNGDETTGDGWRYRGGGLIQLSFKANYVDFATECSKPLDETPDYVRSKEGAVHSACWYWKEHNINKWANIPDVDGASDVINIGRKTEAIGDAIGYTDRLKRFNSNLIILK